MNSTKGEPHGVRGISGLNRQLSALICAIFVASFAIEKVSGQEPANNQGAHDYSWNSAGAAQQGGSEKYPGAGIFNTPTGQNNQEQDPYREEQIRAGFAPIDIPPTIQDRFFLDHNRDCFASDGNGNRSVLANLVSEPFRRKVPWQERENVDTLKQLTRWRF